MSIINTFLQKIKLRENNHGIFMVTMAYIMSFVMLVLGSDVFYNMRSKAADISNNIQNEEIILNEDASDNDRMDRYLKAPQPKLLENDLINPYGLKNYDDRDTDEVAKQELTNTSSNKQDENFALTTNLAVTNEVATTPKEQATSDTKDNVASKSTDSAATETLSVTKAVNLPFTITKEEVGMLERIVEAEAGGEDIVGKILIANVIFNRVVDEEFPDSVKKVIFQKVNGKYQFSPITDERFWSVEVSKGTKKAVKRAMEGEDYSEGALYFMSRKKSKKNNVKWFDDQLKWLFKHGGHEFFR